jgi:hypothetical protein
VVKPAALLCTVSGIRLPERVFDCEVASVLVSVWQVRVSAHVECTICSVDSTACHPFAEALLFTSNLPPDTPAAPHITFLQCRPALCRYTTEHGRLPRHLPAARKPEPSPQSCKPWHTSSVAIGSGLQLPGHSDAQGGWHVG